jgi:hypothetical protein
MALLLKKKDEEFFHQTCVNHKNIYHKFHFLFILSRSNANVTVAG